MNQIMKKDICMYTSDEKRHTYTQAMKKDVKSLGAFRTYKSINTSHAEKRDTYACMMKTDIHVHVY